jgi:hypothetical protein
MSVIEREWVIYICRGCGDIRGEDPCARCCDSRLRGAIEESEKLRALVREYLRVDGSQGRYDALALHAARLALLDHLGDRSS